MSRQDVMLAPAIRWEISRPNPLLGPAKWPREFRRFSVQRPIFLRLWQFIFDGKSSLCGEQITLTGTAKSNARNLHRCMRRRLQPHAISHMHWVSSGLRLLSVTLKSLREIFGCIGRLWPKTHGKCVTLAHQSCEERVFLQRALPLQEKVLPLLNA